MWKSAIAVVFVAIGMAFVLTPAVQAEPISYPLGEPPAEFLPEAGQMFLLIREDLRGDLQTEDGEGVILDVVPLQLAGNDLPGGATGIRVTAASPVFTYDTTWWNPDWEQAANPEPFETHAPDQKPGATNPNGFGLLSLGGKVWFHPKQLGPTAAPKVQDLRVLVDPSAGYDIEAFYSVGLGETAMSVVVVPEPGTIALLLTGLLGSALLIRRRRR